jgi:hypothetical protein
MFQQILKIHFIPLRKVLIDLFPNEKLKVLFLNYAKALKKSKE